MKLKQLLEQLNQLAKEKPEVLEMEVYGEETEYKFRPIVCARMAIIGKTPKYEQYWEVTDDNDKDFEYKRVIIIE